MIILWDFLLLTQYSFYMNKFVLAADGLNLSQPSIDYAAYLAKTFNSHLIVAFLEDIGYRSDLLDSKWWPYYSDEEFEQVDLISKTDAVKQEKAVAETQIKLQNAGLSFGIHRNKLIAIQSLLKESYFTDAIILDSRASFSNYDRHRPSRFIHDLLMAASCPVILTPEAYQPVDRFVFAYDGDPSSAYAIKQFTYLFPDVEPSQLEVVYITENQDESHPPHYGLLKELLSYKYENVIHTTISSKNAEEALINHLSQDKRHCMLIMGSYSRNFFSMWIKPSTADNIIRELSIPLFITHR